MSTSLRSLSGLIDFECAARWQSFRLAARELHKTPAAVSQQIKQLEQVLGFALFTRHPRHIALTGKGHELADSVSRLLGELQVKVDALRDEDEERILRISTTHSFAMKWLVPRLHRFTERHPGYELRIDANDEPVELGEGGCDVAIRYGRVQGAEPASLLYREQLVVACSPRLIAGLPASPPLEALLRQPLLFEGTPELWLRLLETNGIPSRHCDFSRRYSHAGLLVQAAVAGQGVALLPFSLACEDIAQGRLLLCPCRPQPSAYGYSLLRRESRQEVPKIGRFAEWLCEETAEMHRQHGHTDSVAST